MDIWYLAILTLSWLAYFLLHSFFASLFFKRIVEKKFPGLMPVYRLMFNALAVILLVVPLWLLFSYEGETIIAWTGVFKWLSHLLLFSVIWGFLWSMRYYDGSEFLGIRQLRDNVSNVKDQENFHISPLHRYVRHPWYFLGLVLIWSRDMNAAFLVSASMMTAYFVIGSRAEEKKLFEYHGEVYREYVRRVPGLLPLPWKYLNKSEAEQLLTEARHLSETNQ